MHQTLHVIIPEYSGETRLLQKMLLNLTEPVSMQPNNTMLYGVVHA